MFLSNRRIMWFYSWHFPFFLVAIFLQCFDDFVRQINRLTTNVLHHIETSQLTCNANQLTGFYMMENIGR